MSRYHWHIVDELWMKQYNVCFTLILRETNEFWEKEKECVEGSGENEQCSNHLSLYLSWWNNTWWREWTNTSCLTLHKSLWKDGRTRMWSLLHRYTRITHDYHLQSTNLWCVEFNKISWEGNWNTVSCNSHSFQTSCLINHHQTIIVIVVNLLKSNQNGGYSNTLDIVNDGVCNIKNDVSSVLHNNWWICVTVEQMTQIILPDVVP